MSKLLKTNKKQQQPQSKILEIKAFDGIKDNNDINDIDENEGKELTEDNEEINSTNITINNNVNKTSNKSNKSNYSKQNNNDIYKNVILDEYIYLKSADLNYAIDAIILLKLKKKIEGTCIKIGYVIPDSIKIVTRSLGIINNANFDGITTYKLKYTADVCNPVIGSIIKCSIGNVDKSQIICYIDNADVSPVEIYLYKQHHITNNDFLQLKIGDLINVKVCGSTWAYKDTRIISIAQYINTV